MPKPPDLTVKPLPDQDVVIVAPTGLRFDATKDGLSLWRNSGHDRIRALGAVTANPAHGHPVPPPPPPDPEPEPEPEPEPPPVPTPTGALWISPARLASLPTSGPAWARLVAKAGGSWGNLSFSSYTEDAAHDVMAGALVAARTNDAALKGKVVTALSVVYTTPGGSDPAKYVTRILPELVMAASLVGHRTAAFEARLRQIMAINFSSPDPGTIAERNRKGPGNGGAMSGASTAAVGVYLNDSTFITQAIDGLRAFCGLFPGSTDPRGGAWNASHPDQSKFVPVNPANSPTRNGMDLSSLMPSEMERGSASPTPTPGVTGYPDMNCNGRTVQAVILFEAGKVGPEVWTLGDRAMERAARRLAQVPGYANPGMHHNHLLNYYANAGLAAAAATKGRCTWGVDWTHAR